MLQVLRRSRLIAAAAAITVGLSLVGVSPGASGVAGSDSGRQLAPAGPSGPTIVVEDQASFSGFDLATDPSTGVAYLGWISSSVISGGTRVVHLCVLPPGAGSCLGGVLTTSAVDGPSAAGLQVEVTAPGTATLVWFHNFANVYGAITTATYAGGVLSAPSTVANAAINGQLFDVVPGPDGQLWGVSGDPSATGQNLRIHQGITGFTQQAVTAPWLVGNASLAFHGSQPVLVVAKYGSISDTLAYASGNPMSGFKSVPKTWTTGLGNDLVGTSHGVRLIASEPNAGYRPQVARWTGDSFKKPELIGENSSCPGLSHDLVTDGSGRIADVVERCGKLIVYNLPDTETAAKTAFSTGGTVAGAPQITTTTRGYGWVAWGTLSPTTVANRLQVRPVRLPALMVDKSKSTNAGKVTVTGPATCLPVVSVKAKVAVKPGQGWNVASKSLKLDGDAEGTSVKIDGESLPSGSKHKLVGKGVFKKGGQTATVTTELKFKVC